MNVCRQLTSLKLMVKMKPLKMETSIFKNVIIKSNKKGVYVPLFVIVLLLLTVFMGFMVFIQQLSFIRISFTQNVEAPFNTMESTVQYSQDHKNNINIVQKIHFGDRHVQEKKPTLTCVKEGLPEILKKVNVFYVNRSNEVRQHIVSSCNPSSSKRCENFLLYSVPVDMSDISLSDLHSLKQLSAVQKGGWWLPHNCSMKETVAIIIPFRDRDTHLAKFLRHMHPILQRQNIHYRIFVIDQVDKNNFNRGKLMNVGFKEALKFFPYNCFVFHDVDLLLENDNNFYGCLSSPQHMSTAINKFKYRILYEELFGGIEMFTKKHFELVNGFSNSFWGWGAEDDNLFRRLAWKNLTVWRASIVNGRYHMIRHHDRETTADVKRYELRQESYKHYRTDGLVNLQYDVKGIHFKPFHTLIKVDLRKDKDKLFGVKPFY